MRLILHKPGVLTYSVIPAFGGQRQEHKKVNDIFNPIVSLRLVVAT